MTRSDGESARDTVSVDTGAFKRKRETGSIGMPTGLYELMQAAGWDSPYYCAVEAGGRGVLHPTLGWVSAETLREIAEEHDEL